VNKPNYLIAGFSRCGSTYLQGLLSQHPEVSVSTPRKGKWRFDRKEAHFYGLKNRWVLWERDGKWWKNSKEKHWQKCMDGRFKDRKYKIEFSYSTYDDTAPEYIKRKLGDINIIFLIRNKEDFKRSLHINFKSSGKIPKNMSWKRFNIKYGNKIEYLADFERVIKLYKKHFTKVTVFDIDNDGINKFIKWMGLDDFKYHEVPKHTREDAMKLRRPFEHLRTMISAYVNSTKSSVT